MSTSRSTWKSPTGRRPHRAWKTRNAGFSPDASKVWRWQAEDAPIKTIVRFELLADLDDSPAGATVEFAECDDLGAVNLRGTGFAADDFSVQAMTARVGDVVHNVEVKVAGLAGFLLAKVAAAHSRRKPKDWYDIAFVLLHNDEGGPAAAGARVEEKFSHRLRGPIGTALDDLYANFSTSTAQGPRAYTSQITQDHPDLDGAEAAADAVAAVEEFYTNVTA